MPSQDAIPAGLEFGRIYRDQGMLAASGHTSEAWKRSCEITISELASTGKEFNFDEIFALIGEPPSHRNVIGAIINAAVRRGDIVHASYRQATRAAGHARHVKTYVGAKFAQKTLAKKRHVLVITTNPNSPTAEYETFILPFTRQGLSKITSLVSEHTKLPPTVFKHPLFLEGRFETAVDGKPVLIQYLEGKKV